MPSQETIARAAENIVHGLPAASEPVLLVCSAGKRPLALAAAAVLRGAGRGYHLLELGAAGEAEVAPLGELLHAVAGRWPLVLLLEAEQAPLLFDLAGRPDEALLLPEGRYYCDWLATPDCTARTMGVDMDELLRFRRALLDVLAPAEAVRVVTAAGTDLTVRPRAWHATTGEVYTAPLEGLATGRIVIDGSVYDGPLVSPVTLEVAAGRVTNLAALAVQTDARDRRRAWLCADLVRDAGAGVVAELGIGVNPGARPDVDLMEAEQARGTCHFGFGRNLAFGGGNDSAVHLDGTLLRPNIWIDGRLLCDEGTWRL
jgi:hypothetical protein